MRVEALVPGVRHVYLWLPRGPWALHVLAVDSACSPVVEARKAGPPLDARAPTSELAGDALAAINADFFMTPGGTPVGAHVTGGRVVVGPGRRPVYAVDDDGGRFAGPADLAGWAAIHGDTAALTQVNRPRDAGRHHPVRPGLTLFDDWFGDTLAVDSSAATLRLRPIEGAAGSAPRGGRAVVEAVLEAGDPVAPGSPAAAIRGMGPEADGWVRRRAVGDTVTWSATVRPGGGVGPAAREVVGGFPVLVADGRDVLAEQEGVIPSFGDARHPRTAVGWDPGSARLWWVVVDGRQTPYSAGMSLDELTRLLLRLGASHAINLDGGGSTTLVVDGRVANRPSDEEGERPVANVLALTGCLRR